jgi:xylulokinase
LDAPIVLIGGGAKGTAWRETVRRLSGRRVLVPADPDLVARGAAAQAAAALTGTDPINVQSNWASSDQVVLEPMPVDQAVLERYRRVREGVIATVGSLRG